ncbi:MAG: S8 family serine peptidase [Acidimicrobiia bacterium]
MKAHTRSNSSPPRRHPGEATRRRFFALVAALALFVATAPGLSSAGTPVEPDTRADEVVLRVAAGSTIGDIHGTYGSSTIRALPIDSTFLVAPAPGQTVKAFLGAVEDDLRLVYAEPNFIVEASRHTSYAWGGFDPTPGSTQDSAGAIGLPAAHQVSRGDGVVVAVIDTGVQLDHPELASVLSSNGWDFVDGDATPAEETGEVGNPGDHHGLVTGHGTHVAGVVHLTAPEASIIPIRVLDPHGRGDIVAIADAIVFAVENGADVINLSLGVHTDTNLLADAARTATRGGALVTAATGNFGTMEKQSPAAARCALGVAAVDASGIHQSFSTYGSWVDFAAPGLDVFSTFPVDGYAFGTGTSVSAPFVAGEAALVMSAAPDLGARDVAMVMEMTAMDLKDLNPEVGGKLGAGLIDAGAAVALLQGQVPSSGGPLSGSCFSLDQQPLDQLS